MTQSHIEQNLPLKNKVIPVDENTIFLAHYDVNENDVLSGIQPIGYPYALNVGVGDSYMRIPNLLMWSSIFTISFWIKHNSPVGWSDILTFDTGVDGTAVRIEKDNTTTSYRWYTDSGFVSGTILFDHDGLQWDHIALVCDGTKVYSYKNGVLVFSGPKHSNNLPSSSFINIGRRLTSQYWNGSISRLMMWRTARSQNQIQTDMVAELKGDEPGLVGYWKLNEGSGSFAVDYSLRGNAGVITNPKWTSGVQVSTLSPQGYYGGGIAVEEATTNLLAPNTTFAGWNTFSGSSVQVTQGYPDPFGGNNATRIQASGGTSVLKYYGDVGPGTASVPCTASLWVKNNSSTSLILSNQINGLSGTITKDMGWIYKKSSGTSNGTSNRQIRFHTPAVADSLDFFAYQPQMETKSFATSFVNGTRANGRLYYPVSITRPSTISFWVQPRVTDDYIASVNWVMGQSPYSDNFILWKRVSENYYRLRVAGTDIALSPGDITAFTWSHVAVVFDTLETRLYVNGIQKGTCGVVAPISILTVGSADGQNTGNNIFDELRIDKIARTSDEILAWYYSNSPFWPKGIYKVSY